MALETNGEVNGHSEHRPDNGAAWTDVLIIGAGPAGASLACFLAAYGLKGIIVSRASGTADTPRAHITSMAALECLRDIGIDKDCIQRKGDYELASPCKPCDLPQTLLEPVLVRHATTNGFKCRWDTSFVSFRDLGGDNGVVTTLRDDISGSEYRIHSKYLFGADGARSRVVKQLDLPLNAKPGGGIAINVLVKADLTHLMQYRRGNLHWVIQPDRAHCDFGQMGIVRMVKPWFEWMFILLPKPGWEGPDPSREEYLQRVRDFIGDDSIPAEIISVSKWFINETVAEQYSQGNVFCLGDAVHRHPPFNGLGSNTCIQDAFNLAWKVAYVHLGRANRSLLSSYSTERQPVGQSIVTRANDGFREHSKVWDAIGILPEGIDIRKAILQEFTDPGIVGQKRRAALKNAIHNTRHEFHGLGIEMNQLYGGSGIYAADEQAPFKYQGPAAENPILYHMRSTYPGRRLPHAWLNKRNPTQAPISTIDLAGKGRFTIFTGVGGGPWKNAAEVVATRLGNGLQIDVFSIGPNQQWEDVYSEWASVREVGDSGAVLVRPDRFIAWRSQELASGNGTLEGKLLEVFKNILGLV